MEGVEGEAGVEGCDYVPACLCVCVPTRGCGFGVWRPRYQSSSEGVHPVFQILDVSSRRLPSRAERSVDGTIALIVLAAASQTSSPASALRYEIYICHMSLSRITRSDVYI